MNAVALQGPDAWWRVLLLGAAIMVVLMSALWAWHLRLRNAAIVDVGWGAGLGILAGLYALLGPAPVERRLLLAFLAGLWAFRLSLHLWRDRVAGGRPEEGRYQALRAAWGPDPATINRKFYLFFLSQGVLNVLLALPFLLVAWNPAPALHALEIAAAILWALAILGEARADAQLKAFKARAAAEGRHGEVCKDGLWRWSRHPNYFGEWLIWCAYALLATTSPLGYLAWISPAVILYLLLKVTGIPPTEAQSLKSRGAAYRRYQQETSAFFPWFPRRPT